MATIARLNIKIGADWGDAKQAFKDVQSAVGPVADTMKSVGRTMSTFVTAPIVAMGTAAGISSAKLESAFSKIEGLVGVPREELQGMEKDLLALAPATGIGPQELADALFFVTSAGLRGAAAIDVLRASAKASAAGLGETKTIADLVTSAVNAYGIQNLSAASATDVLVGAVREGKAEAPALAGAMGRVLPIASEMGVSFDQVGASVAAMTRTGTDAFTATTQLRAILQSLLNPAADVSKVLGEFGFSAAGIRKQIREEGLFSALMSLKTAFGENQEAIGRLFPNQRALLGFLDLMGANVKDNEAIFRSLTDTTGLLDTAFGAAADTIEFKWKQAIAAGKVVLLTFRNAIKESLVPILNTAIKTLSSLAQSLEDLSPGTKTAVLSIAGLVAAIGPLTFGAGTLLAMLPHIVAGFKLIGITSVALAGKVALVTGAIGLLAAGFLLVANNWDTVGQNVLKGLREIMTGIEFVAKGMAMLGIMSGNVLGKILLFGQKLDDNIAAGATDGIRDFTDAINSIPGATPENLEDILGSWAGLAGAEEALGLTTPQVTPEPVPGGKPAFNVPSLSGVAGLGPDLLPSNMAEVPEQLRGFSDKVILEMAQLNQRMEIQRNEFSRLVKEMVATIRTGMTNALVGLAEGFGQMAAGTASLGDIGKNLLSAFGGILQQLGSALIAFGVAGVNWNALGGFLGFLNPISAAGQIAIGAALVAAGAGIKAVLSNASGRSGGGGPSWRGSSGGLSSNPNIASTFGSDSAGVDSRISVQVVPSVMPSGDVVYSGEEGTRRRNRRGQPMV